MNAALAADAVADSGRKFVQNIGRRIVGDRMHGIQTQTVDMKLLEPIERVVQEEIANDTAPRAIEIDAASPWRLMAIGKKVGRVSMQVIAFRSEVVVNDVLQNHQTVCMRGVDERLQCVG